MFEKEVWNFISQYSGAKFNSLEEAQQNCKELYEMLLRARPNTPYKQITASYYFCDKGLLVDDKGVKCTLYREISYRATSDLLEALKRLFLNEFSSEIKNQVFLNQYVEKKEVQYTLESRIKHSYNFYKKYVHVSFFMYGVDHSLELWESMLKKKLIFEENDKWVEEAKKEKMKKAKFDRDRSNSYAKILEAASILQNEILETNSLIARSKCLQLENYFRLKYPKQEI